jgi:hypothetical protein
MLCQSPDISEISVLLLSFVWTVLDRLKHSCIRFTLEKNSAFQIFYQTATDVLVSVMSVYYEVGLN